MKSKKLGHIGVTAILVLSVLALTMSFTSADPIIYEEIAPSEPITPQVQRALQELIYDDGEVNGRMAWQYGGNKWAVRFTPRSYPINLDTARICLSSDSDREFAVEVYDDDGPDGEPGTLLGGPVYQTATEGENWNDVEISELGITITGGDFYIAYCQLTDYPNCTWLCYDRDPPFYERSWSCYSTGHWHFWHKYNNFMIRCVVNTLGPTTGITTDEYQYTPGDTMTITVDIENPTASSVDTYFVWLFQQPEFDYMKPILVTRLTLPPYFDRTYNMDLPVGDWAPVGFNAEWYVALLEPIAPYELISYDTTEWCYVPTKAKSVSTVPGDQNIAKRRDAPPTQNLGEVDPEEIAEAILKTIAEVELLGERTHGEPIPEEIVNEILEDIAEWQFESTKTDSGEAGAEDQDTAIEHYDWLPAP